MKKQTKKQTVKWFCLYWYYNCIKSIICTPGMSSWGMSDMLHVLVRWIAMGSPTQRSSVAKQATPIPPIHPSVLFCIGKQTWCMKGPKQPLHWGHVRVIQSNVCLRARAHTHARAHSSLSSRLRFLACEIETSSWGPWWRMMMTNDWAVIIMVFHLFVSLDWAEQHVWSCLPEVNYPVEVEGSCPQLIYSP